MWIWVCGPYATGSADKSQRAANLRFLNEAALDIFRRGHTPIIGANMALPMIQAAGLDDASHDIRLPLSLALLEKCDACLRIGGESRGTDIEVEAFKASGRPVFSSLSDIPDANRDRA
jgi:hypothetical protein